MATLLVTDGPATGGKFALEQHNLVLVGRDASCTFQIIDPQLSRGHLQVKFVEGEGRHYAIDFGSKNGVLVNDASVAGDGVPLSDRDVIKIGGTTIVYTTDDTLDAQHVREAMKMFGQGHVKTIEAEAD